MVERSELLVMPRIRVRGRSVMALVVTPEPPLAAWFAELDEQMVRVAGLFGGRPVVADLSLAAKEGREAVLIVLDGLEARDLRIIGLEGVEPVLLTATRWAQMPVLLGGKADRLLTLDEAGPRAAAPAPPPAPQPGPASLLIEAPVRSGQSICFEHGDITVIGHLASGAEVIAGGSIHIYGALRGRAIAGLKTGPHARIFCRRMEAEMVGVDRLYRTAEHWGAGLHGRAAQVRCDRGVLRIAPLD